MNDGAAHAWRMLVDMDDIRSVVLERDGRPAPKPARGAIVAALKLCGLTANNVTYAALGRRSGGSMIPPYWDFFPSGAAGQGLLPVWGFAEVTASSCRGIAVGEELYGFFPLASHVTLRPDAIGSAAFTDGSEHRLALPSVYNSYTRMDAAPLASTDSKALWAVFRPLLATGFLVADQLQDEQYAGAEQIVVASASSKTAMMTAFCLNAKSDRPKLVGLTSAANEVFLRQAALYDEVIGYDQLDMLDPTPKSVFVDMAGNRALTRQVHDHLGDRLLMSLMVGLSHWDAATGELPRVGPTVTPFFAPGRMQKRTADWGARGLAERISTEWAGFIEVAAELVQVEEHRGAAAAVEAYRRLVAGAINPRHAQVIEF